MNSTAFIAGPGLGPRNRGYSFMDALDGPRVSEAVRVEPATGRFSIARSNYTDPAIFRAEMERIFSKCWLYVGHTSELAAARSVHHAQGRRTQRHLSARPQRQGPLLPERLPASRRADLPASRRQGTQFQLHLSRLDIREHRPGGQHHRAGDLSARTSTAAAATIWCRCRGSRNIADFGS